MKKCLVVLSALFLASCLNVDNFGAYWDKMSLDPGLKGTWLNISGNGHETGVRKTVSFMEKNGAYEVVLHADNKPADKPIYPVKGISVGSYHFLAARDPQKGTGMIIRYELENDQLTFYKLNERAAGDFIKKHYPDATNIGTNAGSAFSIKLFDDDVYRILSDLPDNDTYWSTLEVEERTKR